MKRIKVIKIGGKVIENEDHLNSFLQHVAELEGGVILVHGGGSIATDMGKKLGIATQMIDGRRITDTAMLDVITMVYGGLANKKIAAKLQGLGRNAIGLSGADLNLVQSIKRAPTPIDYGWVGDIDRVDTDWLLEFTGNNVIPVLAPLTHDGNGSLLNTNADSVASFVAAAISQYMETELLFCFEMDGVKNGKGFLKTLKPHSYNNLKSQKVITDGMIPKIDLGFSALEKGVHSVSIRSFKNVKTEDSGTKLIL